ncbi:hypothetical protein [Natrialba taiwanensis]|uniref:PGF-CTERM sorting domain-containing protein n=1 Tax=Natrialba taiwanensis DSM 12281 TaxID=1230458 RepID=L9ZFQ2_9EURY|nr:hypothetical protein [Natrialba taiwanensis]ELY85290.1 hypothetical protein C484_20657 [Natrialba taiwanensis DSM 12281]
MSGARDSPSGRRAVLVVGICALLGTVAALGPAGAAAAGTGSDPVSAVTQQYVSEEEYVEAVPEQGDPYFEAAADDGSWISYTNPRDDYRMPYLGEGSGKMCVTLVNEAGQPVSGESVPDTTVTIPTGESLSWHQGADPFTVEYPLTDNYNRPMDGDQFGTSELPQGDGYLDSHCVEWHGLPENETVEYGEVEIGGPHADQIELVGYIQQANQDWKSNIDPLEAAEPYEEAGGSWTYTPDGSHGDLVAVLQLDGDADIPVNETDGDADDGTGTGSDSDTDTGDNDGDSSTDTNDTDTVPGFGVLAALGALLAAVAVRRRG